MSKLRATAVWSVCAIELVGSFLILLLGFGMYPEAPLDVAPLLALLGLQGLAALGYVAIVVWARRCNPHMLRPGGRVAILVALQLCVTVFVACAVVGWPIENALEAVLAVGMVLIAMTVTGMLGLVLMDEFGEAEGDTGSIEPSGYAPIGRATRQRPLRRSHARRIHLDGGGRR